MTKDNESTATAGHLTAPDELDSLDGDEAYESSDGLRSTADNNLIIMLNGEMIFGKQDGDYPRPRPNVLRGGVVPSRALVTSPAMVSGAGVRESNASLCVQRHSLAESNLFDQSTFEPLDDLSYDHRPISPIGDASVGSMQQIAREIDMMEGSYFSSVQPPVQPRLDAPVRSVLSARGMDSIKDSSSEEENDDDMQIKRYPLSTPYRSNQLEEDWVKAWGQAWGLNVNKAEEQKRRNRLLALQTKHEQHRVRVPAVPITGAQKSKIPASEPRVRQGDGPSVAAVLNKSLAKAAAQVTSSPPPAGPKSPAKSPWADRTMDWAGSQTVCTPPTKTAAVLDGSIASTEKTVKKSKWVFGDDELTEDEEDEKLGEENQDGEEAWTRSAKKQFRAIEPFRKMPQFGVNELKLRDATVSAQRKHSNPHAIRKHAMSMHESHIASAADSEDASAENQSVLKYTPDIARLKMNREKLRKGEYDDDEEYRPLFRRNDGRLVRKFNSTSIDDSVMPSTIVDLGHQDRVGAWV